MKTRNSIENTAKCVINPLLCSTVSEPFTNNKNNMSEAEQKGAILGALIYILIVVLVQIMPVMLIAVHCNPDNPIMYGIVSFLFPTIYLLQHAVRKYLNQEKGYCGNK